VTGELFVVATPIGNLGDISLRALEVLSSVDAILAEDTRHSRRLLDHHGITTPLWSLHEHNEKAKTASLIDDLSSGKKLALISDAGTPLISDPGFCLVREARDAGIAVMPLPGPCAFVAALSVAGLASDAFSFFGFLPPKQQARINALKRLADRTETLIFYEAPHRVLATLADMQTVFGDDRLAVMARELSKSYETVKKASLLDLVTWVESDPNQQKGEIVLLIEGKRQQTDADFSQALSLYDKLKADLPMKRAVKLASEVTGVSKNQLYQMVISAK
jgi:16S rRNA (cytidine1402-2'-O)-methyltransferase